MKKSTKLSSLLLMSLFLMAFTFTACEKDETPEVRLTFDKATIEVEVGDTEIATVNNGTSPYTATSADTEKATVSVESDKISIVGVETGTTTITVRDKDQNTGQITVTVVQDDDQDDGDEGDGEGEA